MVSLSDEQTADRPLTVLSSRPLRGRFRVGPDPELFCLAAMLGAVSTGTTVLYHDAVEFDANRRATLELLREVGTTPEVLDDRWEINGLGTMGLLEPERPLDFSHAERATPLALGLLGPYGFASRLIGDTAPGAASLSPTIEALRTLGVDIREQKTGRLPMTLRGPRSAVPFELRLAGALPRTKTALLLAALALPGISTLIEAEPTADEPERLFRHFGASIAETNGPGGRMLSIGGLPRLGARTFEVPGDADLVPFPLLAALVVPDSDVLIENVAMLPARQAVLAALREMGGTIEEVDRRLSAGTEIADLRVSHSPLLGIDVEPRGLDAAAIPPLAVAGAFAAGETRLPRLGFTGEAGLHKLLAETLAGLGASTRADARGLTVGRPERGRQLGGDHVVPGGNPHVAAAFAVLGLGAGEQVTIDDEVPLNAAFPHLLSGLEALGAEFYRLEAA